MLLTPDKTPLLISGSESSQPARCVFFFSFNHSCHRGDEPGQFANALQKVPHKLVPTQLMPPPEVNKLQITPKFATGDQATRL